MKKLIILLVLILLFIPALVQAETVFHDIELSEAVRKMAEEKGENVIFVTNPPDIIDKEVDSSQDFSEILKELLADSNYRFIQHSDYYLVGKFSCDSAEFASRAETLFYRAKYLSADILAEKLDFPELRVTVLDNEDQLLLQGLPRDIAEAKKIISEFDRKEELSQLKYRLTMIDITEESKKQLDIEEISNSNEEEGFEFFYSGGNLELIMSEIINSITMSGENSAEESLTIANPSLVTEVGSSGTLDISEEIISWSEGEVSSREMGFSTVFTPHTVSNEGKIKTEIEFKSGVRSLLSTTIWLKLQKTELLGLLKMNNKKTTGSLTGKSEKNRERSYAIYITVERADSSSVTKLAGLEDIIFSDHQQVNKIEPGYLQCLLDSKANLDIDFYSPYKETENSFSLRSREGKSYLEVAFKSPLTDGLAVDSRAIFEDKSSCSRRLLIGLNDTVRINDVLKLKAGLYPIDYALEEEKFIDKTGYAELDYRPESIFINLRYSNNLGKNPIRIETGYKVNSSSHIVIALSGEFSEVDRLLTGVRIEY